MVDSFFGLDLPCGGRVIVWSHLLENLLLYIISLALKIHANITKESSEYKKVLLYEEELSNHFRWASSIDLSNFGAVFSLIGGMISLFCLMIKRPKVFRILWLTHQGITVELMTIILIRVVIAEDFSSKIVISSIPIICFAALKVYSWLVIVALYKCERAQEKKELFGAQWITNSLLASPGMRLTMPTNEQPELIPSYYS